MTDPSVLYHDALELARPKPAAAARRLKRRADSGDIEAKFQLAVVLARDSLLAGVLTGKTTLNRDQVKATRLLRELHTVDFDGTAYLLGYLYRTVDPQLAKQWLRIAAKRDDFWTPMASMVLGILLSEAGSEEAVGLLEDAVTGRGTGGLARFYLARAIEGTDPNRALDLYRLAYQNGINEAYYCAGQLLYASGDTAEARRLYETGAKRGDTSAMLRLYQVLRGTERSTALLWLSRHVRAGGPIRLGKQMYRRELHDKPGKRSRWYRKHHL